MHSDATKQMRDAIATYTGPVTLCRPGRPRAPKPRPPDPPQNKSVAWLQGQPGGGWPKEAPEAKRQRFKAQRMAIARHNEVVRKAHGLSKGEIG